MLFRSGFHPITARVKKEVVVRPIQEVFRSAGFVHPEVDAVIDDDSEEDLPVFVMHGLACHNWIAVDVPLVMHISEECFVLFFFEKTRSAQGETYFVSGYEK